MTTTSACRSLAEFGGKQKFSWAWIVVAAMTLAGGLLLMAKDALGLRFFGDLNSS